MLTAIWIFLAATVLLAFSAYFVGNSSPPMVRDTDAITYTLLLALAAFICLIVLLVLLAVKFWPW